MIKVYSNKLGGIFIEKDLLKNSFLSIIKDYVNSKENIDVTFDIKRNTLKFINVHFSKKICLSRQEEKNLYEQLIFVLSNKFQINNKIITFSYEN
ncbi:hypothetical protein [Malacoplasma muris]|uniref:hypothetical protein n=1 Tax=Malacoplasma muris TaxID=2119 RepID=UPI00398F4D01